LRFSEKGDLLKPATGLTRSKNKKPSGRRVFRIETRSTYFFLATFFLAAFLFGAAFFLAAFFFTAILFRI
jgi:hypothetical protein